MDAWDGWELGRAIVASSAVLYAGMWLQLTLMHWGAAFRRWEMIPPVIYAPLIVAACALAVWSREGFLGWLAAVILVGGVLEGLAGTFFHVRGMVAQVGGFSMRNAIAGPPPVLPLAFALVGVLGLIGLFWDG